MGKLTVMAHAHDWTLKWKFCQTARERERERETESISVFMPSHVYACLIWEDFPQKFAETRGKSNLTFTPTH